MRGAKSSSAYECLPAVLTLNSTNPYFINICATKLDNMASWALPTFRNTNAAAESLLADISIELKFLHQITSSRPRANDRYWLRPQPSNATFYSLSMGRGMLNMKYNPRIYYTET